MSETTTLEAPPTEGDSMEVELKASDRCDRCGAQAFIRAVMDGGEDLLFCGHHGHANKEALAKVAVHVYDYTATINQTASMSANAQ